MIDILEFVKTSFGAVDFGYMFKYLWDDDRRGCVFFAG
jgi:hypothetical protein